MMDITVANDTFVSVDGGRDNDGVEWAQAVKIATDDWAHAVSISTDSEFGLCYQHG